MTTRTAARVGATGGRPADPLTPPHERTTMTTDQTPTPESARALLYRHGVPEDVIDGALALHAQELVAVQRAFAEQEDSHLRTTSASVYVQGIRDGADLIDPALAADAPVPPPADRAAVLAEAIAALEKVRDATDINVAVYPRYDWQQKSAINAGISVLRRMAAEEQPAETPSMRLARKSIESMVATVTGEQPETQETDLTERLERGRQQLLEAMSAVSEDRTCCGWAADWARTLHAEGGIWETLGRAVGWPTGNYDQWWWVSWDEAAALYAEDTRP